MGNSNEKLKPGKDSSNKLDQTLKRNKIFEKLFEELESISTGNSQLEKMPKLVLCNILFFLEGKDVVKLMRLNKSFFKFLWTSPNAGKTNKQFIDLFFCLINKKNNCWRKYLGEIMSERTRNRQIEWKRCWTVCDESNKRQIRTENEQISSLFQEWVRCLWMGSKHQQIRFHNTQQKKGGVSTWK